MSMKWGSKPWRIWSNHWRKRQHLRGLRLPTALIVSIMLGCGLGYLLTNHFANWRNWQAFDPEIGLDSMIPFVPWMIIPYATLYFYYPMAAVLGMKDETTQRENIIFHQIFLLLTFMIFGIFMLLPVEVDMRSEVFAMELGIWQNFYNILHTVDTPWNAWPSLHIVQSLLTVLAVTRWYRNENKVLLIRLLWFCWFMLMLSVMATKQHFVWDVFTGIVIATFAWKFWMLPMLENSHSKEAIVQFNQL